MIGVTRVRPSSVTRKPAITVIVVIDADFRAVLDNAAAIDDCPVDSAALADTYVRQDDGFADEAVGFDLDIREQERVLDMGTRHDAAAGHHRLNCLAAPVFVVEDELGRRRLALVREDRPFLVVKVERRFDGHEFHIRQPEGAERTHVTPVGLAAGLRVAKRVSEYPVLVDD